ncbi:MAG: hypothetical protein HQ582_31840, partial [Planctomycetes bacterium]|nr:hypothetical protein [Planctomycetota bacterium]
TQAEKDAEVRQLTVDLHKETVDRGRVWYGCQPQAPEGTGEVAVTTDFPDPNRIEAQTILYVFDQLDVRQGGAYLGQFTVAAIGGRQVQLQPTMRMSETDLAKLQQAATRQDARWALYEIMPVDNHDSLALAELGPELLKAVLPETSVAEYLADGQLMTLGQMKERGLRGKVFKVDESGEVVKRTEIEDIEVAGQIEVEVQGEDEQGKYVRQLRDYEELFRHYALQRTAGIDRQAAADRNRKYVTEAGDDAVAQRDFRQREHDNLVEVRREQSAERDLAAAHREAVTGKLTAIQAAIEQKRKSNQAVGGEIARIQREVTRRIDQQTRRMAQVDLGN